jgi:hypothetical protein
MGTFSWYDLRVFSCQSCHYKSYPKLSEKEHAASIWSACIKFLFPEQKDHPCMYVPDIIWKGLNFFQSRKHNNNSLSHNRLPMDIECVCWWLLVHYGPTLLSQLGWWKWWWIAGCNYTPWWIWLGVLTLSQQPDLFEFWTLRFELQGRLIFYNSKFLWHLLI